MNLDEIFDCTNIDPWFLNQLRELHQAEQWIKAQSLDSISADDFTQIKRRGFSDIQISRLTGKRQTPILCVRKIFLHSSPLFFRVHT